MFTATAKSQKTSKKKPARGQVEMFSDGKEKPEAVHVYVSSKLEIRTYPAEWKLAQDFHDDGTVYRRLDLKYTAYLWHRINLAGKAVQQGSLSREKLAELLERMAAVWDIAVELYGYDKVKKAIQTFNPRRYEGPSKRRKK